MERESGNQKELRAVILPMEANVTKAKLRRVEKPRIPGDAGRAGFSLAVSDPQPMTEVARFWRTAAQSATIGMFIILLVVALNLARPVLLPVASAFVVTMMLGPLSARAEQYKIPSLISAIVLWLLVIAVCYGVIVLLAAPAVDWIGKAPEIGRNVQEKLHVLDRPLAALQELRDALLPSDKKGGLGVDIMSFVQPALLVVTPAIGQTFIFFGTLFFMLLGRSHLRRVAGCVFRRAGSAVAHAEDHERHRAQSDRLSERRGDHQRSDRNMRGRGRMGGGSAGSRGLGRARFHPQFHSLYRSSDR